MRVKVFKAPTLKEAMAQVKEELGLDAVILHTKRYHKGGFLGYKRKEIVEITAAIEDAPPRAKTRKNTAVAKVPVKMPELTKTAFQPKNVLVQYKMAGTSEGVDQARERDNSSRQELTEAQKPVPAPAKPIDTSKPRIIKAEGSLRQGKVMKVETKPQEEKIKQLENELMQMKELLNKVVSTKSRGDDVVTLQEALRSQEVSEAVLRDMAAQMPVGDVLLDKASSEASASLSKYISSALNIAGGITLQEGKPKIVALLGTTGVGKTTTLAKIAARFVLEKGVTAALITADTYRISAVEQLKTYSDIIGLPLEIVYSPEELKQAIKKHSSKQLILIDTAGRSQHNDYQMQELKDLLAVNKDIERHLVLSATIKNRDAKDVLEKFAVCQPDHIMFTKVDETASLGLILNLLHNEGIALSYLTNGQSVPDDILPATADKVTELLLR